jgi:antitoxin component of MazEF toxin-antitoxin module
MEAIAKAKQIGGSIGVIIPSRIVNNERIHIDDTLRIRIEKIDNLNFLWGRYKDIKKSAKQIMKGIDEAELDG